MSGQTTKQQYGLALSGGGFRASLYHLGVIRFLRDVHILPSISTITSVSGGSIIAAHLVLNWERYCGTEEAFQEAADELLRFVRMDVRNRIVRRFPLLTVVNVLRRLLLQGSARRFSRTGLLERHYEEFLYGDTGLMQLPDSPRLYILATNLSEGSLCAFCREGLLLQRRSVADNSMEVQAVHTGLATVSMAVAASSAFPGFFPPLDLSYKDLGATEGEFSQHAFTDGGIYDNLGLRMFRYLQGQIGSAQARGEAGRLMGTTELDGVFVSDAGATLKVRSGSSGGGLLRTAIRSSDILMDRVYQLELGTFAETDKVVFFPITRIVEPTQDRTAMHPEVQRQTALIRTDMDRFTELEISTLVQHGYCVARQVVRELPSFTRSDIPEGPPWDPSASRESVQGIRTDSLGEPAVALPVARMLQRSSNRRIVSTLFHSRDWPTYVWLPLIFLTVFGVPFIIYDARKTAIQQKQVLSALAQSSPLYADVLDLLDQKRPDRIAPIKFEQVDSVEPLDFTGYDVVSDDRVYDLRGWTSGESPQYPARMHARFRILRTEAAKDRPVLRIQLPSDQEEMRAEYFPATLRRVHVRAPSAKGLYTYQTALDFSRVPIGTETTLVVLQDMPANMAIQEFGMGRFKFTVAAITGLVRIWVLLPQGRPHGEFELYRSPIDQPDRTELVHATTSVEVPGGAIATFQLINPPEGYRYECRWRWLDDDVEKSKLAK